jgi:hypothetical protein
MRDDDEFNMAQRHRFGDEYGGPPFRPPEHSPLVEVLGACALIVLGVACLVLLGHFAIELLS